MHIVKHIVKHIVPFSGGNHHDGYFGAQVHPLFQQLRDKSSLVMHRICNTVPRAPREDFWRCAPGRMSENRLWMAMACCTPHCFWQTFNGDNTDEQLLMNNRMEFAYVQTSPCVELGTCQFSSRMFTGILTHGGTTRWEIHR